MTNTYWSCFLRRNQEILMSRLGSAELNKERHDKSIKNWFCLQRMNVLVSLVLQTLANVWRNHISIIALQHPSQTSSMFGLFDCLWLSEGKLDFERYLFYIHEFHIKAHIACWPSNLNVSKNTIALVIDT